MNEPERAGGGLISRLLISFEMNFSALRAAAVGTLLVATAPCAAAPALENAQDFAAFADQAFFQKLEAAHVGQAVLVAVKDGKILYARGFNAKPDETLFQVASISKGFTALAVLQAVEQGKLDLDAKLSNYLPDLGLDAPPFGSPTLRQALTHATGRPDLVMASVARGSKVETLHDYLRERMPPARVAPGSLHSYANLSPTLAGAALEAATSVRMEDWVQQRILAPLGMNHSRYVTARTPLPNEFTLARAGNWDGKRFVPAEPRTDRAHPAIAIQATGNDMARWLLLHLQDGEVDGTRLLSAANMQAMRGEQGRNAPGLPATGFFITRERVGNVAFAGHGGSADGNSSDMHFFPDQGFGYFLSYTAGKGDLRGDFLRALLQRYFDAGQAAEAAPAGPAASAEAFSGEFVDFRYSNPDALTFIWPILTAKVRGHADGTLDLTMPSFYQGGTFRYRNAGSADGVNDVFRFEREIAPGMPASLLGDRIVFRTDADGVQRLYFNPSGYLFAGERLPPWRKAGFVQAVAAVTFAGLAVLLVAWPVALVAGRSGRAPPVTQAMVLQLLSSLCAVAFAVLFLRTAMGGSPWDLLLGFDALGLRPVFFLPLASIAFFLPALLLSLRTRRWFLLAGSVVLLCFVLLAALLRFIGFNF